MSRRLALGTGYDEVTHLSQSGPALSDLGMYRTITPEVLMFHWAFLGIAVVGWLAHYQALRRVTPRPDASRTRE